MAKRLGCLVAFACACAVGDAQTDSYGFVRKWLILGPYRQARGADPDADLLTADYLTDGTVIEESIVPSANDRIETDYAVALSEGLIGGGTPTLIPWDDDDDEVDLNDEVFGGDLDVEGNHGLDRVGRDDLPGKGRAVRHQSGLLREARQEVELRGGALQEAVGPGRAGASGVDAIDLPGADLGAQGFEAAPVQVLVEESRFTA